MEGDEKMRLKLMMKLERTKMYNTSPQTCHIYHYKDTAAQGNEGGGKSNLMVHLKRTENIVHLLAAVIKRFILVELVCLMGQKTNLIMFGSLLSAPFH